MSRFVGKKSRRLIDYFDRRCTDESQSTNVVRVYFHPIDQSGAIYAVPLVRDLVAKELRCQRRAARKQRAGGAS